MRKISISISVTPEVLKKIDQRKEKKNRSRNFIVNQILEDSLNITDVTKKTKVVERTAT